MHRWLQLTLPLSLLLACDGGGDEDDTDPVETDATSEDDDEDDDQEDDQDDDEADTDDTDAVPADPDAVEGGSFEDAALDAGDVELQDSTTVVDGWRFVVSAEAQDAAAATGTARPTSTSFSQVEPLAAPAQGNTCAVVQLTGPTFPPVQTLDPRTQQVVGLVSNDEVATVEVETSYTVRVAVGRPLDSTFTSAYLVISTGTGQLAEVTLSADEITAGAWRDLSVTLDPDDLFEGQPIYLSMQIRHTFIEGGATSAVGYLDHVRVTRTAASADPGSFKPK